MLRVVCRSSPVARRATRMKSRIDLELHVLKGLQSCHHGPSLLESGLTRSYLSTKEHKLLDSEAIEY